MMPLGQSGGPGSKVGIDVGTVPEKIVPETATVVPELETESNVSVDTAVVLYWKVSVPDRSWITAACATDEV